MTVEEICRRAYENKYLTARLTTDQKNSLICSAACDLVKRTDSILSANQEDMKRGRENGMAPGLLDRLCLSEQRIEQIADGMRQVASLPDPVGEVTKMWKRPNGLVIGQKKVPIGVIGVIYEARPNVTADVFSLCFKTGNTVILRGGSAAASTNLAIVDSLHSSLEAAGLPADSVLYIEDLSHEAVGAFMKMDRYVDLLIPRGGAGLIRNVVENSTIPVIETGTGNCHIYVDQYADIDMALRITDNAKTQRIGVCNAAESLVVHEKIAPEFLPRLSELFKGRVSLFADQKARQYLVDSYEATDQDFGREYLDYKMSVKTVKDIDQAISHINHYNTGHSESIITDSYENAQKFLDEVDAACVYVNASTRFTDGNEFGFGAEIGISTQKLHARGPMGLDALLSSKYIIYGNGQIRE